MAEIDGIEETQVLYSSKLLEEQFKQTSHKYFSLVVKSTLQYISSNWPDWVKNLFKKSQ